jgi:hypothetical protein
MNRGFSRQVIPHRGLSLLGHISPARGWGRSANLRIGRWSPGRDRPKSAPHEDDSRELAPNPPPRQRLDATSSRSPPPGRRGARGAPAPQRHRGPPHRHERRDDPGRPYQYQRRDDPGRPYRYQRRERRHPFPGVCTVISSTLMDSTRLSSPPPAGPESGAGRRRARTIFPGRMLFGWRPRTILGQFEMTGG